MKRLQTFVSGIVALTLGTTVVHVKGSGNAVNVTSHLQQPADPSAPVFFSDAAVSGTDAYVTAAGKNPVSSIFQTATGDWQLDTQTSARSVWLDLGDPSLPWASSSSTGRDVHSLLTTHCASIGATPVASLTGVGSSTTCGLSFRINWGSDRSVYYLLHLNAAQHPGTGSVTFTCNVVASNNSCIDWSGRPADDDSTPGDGRSTGLLVKVTSSRQGTTETTIAYYPLNFQIHITNP